MSDYLDEAGPLNYNHPVLANAVVVPGRIVVMGFTVYNSSSSSQYVNVFDANLTPADTSVPLFSLAVAANSPVSMAFTPGGRQFQTGLALNNSSTDSTKTIGSANCFFDVQFCVYEEQNAPGTGA